MRRSLRCRQQAKSPPYSMGLTPEHPHQPGDNTSVNKLDTLGAELLPGTQANHRASIMDSSPAWKRSTSPGGHMVRPYRRVGIAAMKARHAFLVMLVCAGMTPAAAAEAPSGAAS